MDELSVISLEEKRRIVIEEDKCDKIDYLLAAGCGMIGGLIDIFFVGSMYGGQQSNLSKFADKQVDELVKKFAKAFGWNPNTGKIDSVNSAIGYLERMFKVNYDQTKVAGVDMYTRDHHMKSLAHSPSPIGLFFSILNQFTSTSTFLSDGKMITFNTETMELEGGDFISKLFCGFVNWIGHIMSDCAGSSGSRGNGSRGMGVVIPFYELFNLCNFGRFSDGNGNKQTLAQIATRAYSEGYDARFGLALAVPVVITNVSIRLLWGIRRYFEKQRPITECIPTNGHSDLRMMLIVGNGALCVIDGIDAAIRSGGNFLQFFMRLNLIAWFKFVSLVLKEVCIQLGIQNDLSQQIVALERINSAISQYLDELQEIDIEKYKQESELYSDYINGMQNITDPSELSKYLIDMYDNLDIDLPWEGEFDDFMSDSNNTLVFE